MERLIYLEFLRDKEIKMTESTITAKGQTTVPADIRQTIGGVPGTRLVWHVLADGRLFVRVKNKTAADVKGSVKVPQGKRLSLEEMRP
jgi:bifunctional DNA-binding transcriptional regulator/antitoxin component of YhaV-PrlF toxin-antitoxin module